MTQKRKRRIAQKYLEQVEKLNSQIEMLTENLREVESTLGYRAQNYLDRVQTSVSVDGICNSVLQLLNLEVEIEEAKTELLRKKEKIASELDSLSSPKYIKILNYRYLRLMEYEDIADKIGYCGRHITRLHGKALEAFYEEVLKEKEKKDG